MSYERLIYGSYSLDLVITENKKWPDNADEVDAPLYIFGGLYIPDEGETFDENNIIPFSMYQYMYVYDFKVYENNILVSNFVPCYIKSCYDNAGTAGLYDLVEDKFYDSETGENFQYGG